MKQIPDGWKEQDGVLLFTREPCTSKIVQIGDKYAAFLSINDSPWLELQSGSLQNLIEASLRCIDAYFHDEKNTADPDELTVNDLPVIHMKVSNDIMRASGSSPYSWSIYAEKEDVHSARCQIKVDGKRIADITVHADNPLISLSDEVQAVCSAIVWSGLRSVYYTRKKAAGAWRIMEALEQIALYQPIWPGDVVSKKWLRDLERAGMVVRNESGNIVLSERGRDLWDMIVEVKTHSIA